MTFLESYPMCSECDKRHDPEDVCNTNDLSYEHSTPQGWLVENDEGRWDWVGRRIEAVCALTEGRRVYDVKSAKWQ